MFNLARIIHRLDRRYPTLIALRHAEKAEPLTNQPDYLRAITPTGQKATKTLAAWLLHNDLLIKYIKTSPIRRCLQTAQCLQAILMPYASVTTCSLLGDPGAYVADAQLAVTLFQNNTVRDITYQLWQGNLLQGMYSLAIGTQRLLTAIYQDLAISRGHLIYISHDAIWIPFITAIMQRSLPAAYWLDYLQGFVIQCRTAHHLTLILEDDEIEISVSQGV
jgi:hypothetical protein